MARAASTTTPPTTPTTTPAATSASFCSSYAATTIKRLPAIQRILSHTTNTGNADNSTAHTKPSIPTTSNQRTLHVPNDVSAKCEHANQPKQHNDEFPRRLVETADFVLLRPARQHRFPIQLQQYIHEIGTRSAIPVDDAARIPCGSSTIYSNYASRTTTASAADAAAKHSAAAANNTIPSAPTPRTSLPTARSSHYHTRHHHSRRYHHC
jgi:hypothetical protein